MDVKDLEIMKKLLIRIKDPRTNWGHIGDCFEYRNMKFDYWDKKHQLEEKIKNIEGILKEHIKQLIFIHNNEILQLRINWLTDRNICEDPEPCEHLKKMMFIRDKTTYICDKCPIAYNSVSNLKYRLNYLGCQNRNGDRFTSEYINVFSGITNETILQLLNELITLKKEYKQKYEKADTELEELRILTGRQTEHIHDLITDRGLLLNIFNDKCSNEEMGNILELLKG